MAEQSTRDDADQAAKDTAVEGAFNAWRNRPEDLAPEAVDALWEAMWEASDFSWKGLADAGWDRGNQANSAQELKRWRAPADFPGGGTTHGEGDGAWKEATLQDYWRWSLGYAGDETGKRVLTDRELERAVFLSRGSDGRLWHRLHLCPDATLDKDRSAADLRSSTPKEGAENKGAGSGGLTPLLLARLAACSRMASDTADNDRADDGEPGGTGPQIAIRMIGVRSARLGYTLREFAGYGAQDAEDRPRISIDARFAELHDFDARGAQFRGGVGFDGAQFRGEARFHGAQFRGEARFHGAQFRGPARFDGAQFRGPARFDGAQFRGWAGFDGAQFRGLAMFAGAQFRGRALFGGAQFRGRAWFDVAQFCGRAWFGRAQFRGPAGFGRAQFRGRAWFDGAQFRGLAGFGGVQFRGPARFDGAQFRGPARFNDAQFRSEAGFRNAIFMSGDDTGPIRFRTAVFQKIADFSRCRFPKEPERIQGMFETARFLEEARFRSPELDAFSAFDGAVFKGKLLLSAAGNERVEQDRFNAALKATEAAVKDDRRIMSVVKYNPEGDDQAQERGANNRFAALEGGLRVLKTAMEAEKDHMQEHRFFRFELQAKRRRPSVSRLEKVASWSYGLLSDYGNSMGRPLTALGLSVLLLWVVYWGWGVTLDRSFVGVEKERAALEFSIRNVVQPFGPWTATSRSPLFDLELVKIVSCGGPADAVCPTGGGIGWLAFRLLATLQSVFSLLLAFLFALALRKKFQIS